MWIRERVVDHLVHIDVSLANSVAENLGIARSEEKMHTAPPKDVNGLKKMQTSVCMQCPVAQ